MQLIEAYRKILSFAVPVISTTDVAIGLNITNKRAGQILLSLSKQKFVVSLRRNLWGIVGAVESFMLPEYLTAPLPSYISLQSALYYHGMISQMPAVIYAVTMARTRIYETPMGNFSMHHVTSDLFNGYDTLDKNIKMACAEKAFFDFLYFKPAKNKKFFSLPEVEFTQNFAWDKIDSFVGLVKNDSRLHMLQKQIDYYRKN